MRFWPRTLAFQLVAVTAIAVVLSNLGVAAYFDHFNVTQNESFLNDRMVDRATAVATTLREVPPTSRDVVMRTMGSWNWKFTQVPHGTSTAPMNDEETGLANTVASHLATDQARAGAVAVHTHLSLTSLPDWQRPHSRVPPNTEAVQILLPIDAGNMLSAVNLRTPPMPPWEIIWATVVAILVASLAAVFVARRVVRPLSELARAASVGATSAGAVPRVPETGP